MKQLRKKKTGRVVGEFSERWLKTKFSQDFTAETNDFEMWFVFVEYYDQNFSFFAKVFHDILHQISLKDGKALQVPKGFYHYSETSQKFDTDTVIPQLDHRFSHLDLT